MNSARRCSRTACGQPATSTLTYVYADQTAVLGPLALYAEPHAYDLCDDHAEGLSAPRGWEVLRLAPDPATTGPTEDDLLALADAVREAARPAPEVETRGPQRAVEHPPAHPTAHHTGPHTAPPAGPPQPGRGPARRGHLRALTSD